MCHSDEGYSLLSESEAQKPLTHHWRSFPGWGNEHVTFLFTYINGQYNHFGRMWQCSPLIADNVRPKIVEAPLTLTSMTYKQSLDAQQLDAKMHAVVVGRQWIVSMYKYSLRKASKPLNFSSTTTHITWVINDVALSGYSTFSWQFTACRSKHHCLINIARLPHLSSSSSFSVISMTYHKQFSKCQPSAPGLCRELCCWMHNQMQHDLAPGHMWPLNNPAV